MTAIEFLNKDWLLNAPIIEALERGEAKLLSFTEHGVEAMHQEGILLLSLVSDEAILHYKDKLESRVATFFGNIDEDKLRNLLPNARRITPCYQMIYMLPSPPKIKCSLNVEFKQLDMSYAEFIFKNYSNAHNIEHIKKVIERKYMYGAFVDGRIAGFAGRHTEGSMGLLEVMPEFKRKGIGTALEALIIGKVLEEGRVPFGHVVTSNQISFTLQHTIEGVEFADKLVTWIS